MLKMIMIITMDTMKNIEIMIRKLPHNLSLPVISVKEMQIQALEL